MTNYRRGLMKLLMTACCLMPMGFGLHAAEFCVTNDQQLTNALLAAENNGQHDQIKIAVGNYGGGFVYLGTEDFDLTISGGWSGFMGLPCGRQVNTPYDTVLDGNDTERVMLIQASLDSDITVTDLTFINGQGNPAGAGGLLIWSITGYVGDVLIERSAFINNKGHFSSALSTSRGRKITVRNSVFALNQNATGDGTIELLNSDGLGIYFNNNTVVFNTSLAHDANVHSGLSAVASGTSGVFVANNLFWDNDGRDADISHGTSGSHLLNNNISQYFGIVDHVANNFSVEPIFEGGFLNFAPTIASAEINHGLNPPTFIPQPPPFHMQWTTGTKDFSGNTRINDRWVDVGAFEAEVEEPIFQTGFDNVSFRWR